MRIETAPEIVTRMENDFLSGTSKVSKYVDFSMHETLERTNAYLNNTHISGKYDADGNEKPFFDICTAAVNVWYRATDIDRSFIKVLPTVSTNRLQSLAANAWIQDYFRNTNFSMFLNKWGRVLAMYSTAVVKFVEKGDELTQQVVSWQNIICDSIDFENNPQIEIMELTEAQLRRRIETHGYDADVVDDLIATKRQRETKDGKKQDNKNDYIKLYELHGELSKQLLTGEEGDAEIFVQQMHVVSRLDDGADFTLFKGLEEKSPYMLTTLMEEEGRVLGKGPVESLFQAQWMQNDSVYKQKKQLDLATLMLFQTSDGTFAGMNALESMVSGDILVHKGNNPLTQLNNQSHDISAQQAFQNQWKQLGNEINGIAESMLGTAAKSGTAWRQTEAILAESHSLFEVMTENKGFYIQRMLKEWIIPHIKRKKLNSSDSILSTLDALEIKQISDRYLPNSAKRKVQNEIIESLARGEIVEGVDAAVLAAQGTSDSSAQQFFTPSEIEGKTWKEVFKDLEWDIEIDVTGEAKNVQQAMTTANTALQVMNSPGYLQNPQAQYVVGKILDMAGVISPLELDSITGPVQTQLVGETAS